MGFLKSFGFAFFILLQFATAFCQDDALQKVQQRFNAYQQATLQEKIYVHTDKSDYIAGEIIWLKVYCTDAAQHKPLHLSKLAYLDVLDGKNNTVVHLKIRLDEGSGAGSAQLPLSLLTGRYRLRAYTAWMKNFGAAHFFEKPISIFNTLKAWERSAADTAAYTVQVFPEGGNLVNGLKSNVAMKVTGPDGNGVAFSAKIVTETGTVVTETTSSKFGTGTFLITPASGQSYQAVVSLSSGRTIKKELPHAYDQGYVMRVGEIANGKVAVSVNASAANQNKKIFLVAHNRQKVRYAEQKRMDNNEVSFQPDTATLGEGVIFFTLFTEDQKPICERLYFKKPVQKISLQARSDEATYSRRKEVKIDISAAGHVDSLSALNLSLSVYKRDSLQQQGRGINILAYLWLTSELTGLVEAPDYYLSDTATAEATDNLMLTQGWRRFRWEPVLKSDKQAFAFPLEYDGHLLKALVTDTRTGKPAAGISTYLSIPGHTFQFSVAQSDSAGIAYFNVKGHYGPGDLILQTNTRYDSVYSIEVISPFAAPAVSSVPSPDVTFSKPHAGPLLRQSIGMQVQQIYNKDSIDAFRLPNAYDTVPFYGRSDYSYNLDVYTRFRTMEEVLREYVRPVNVTLRRDGLHLLIIDEARRALFQGNELVLLDGIPLFDKNKIFSYDPLKVKKVDVVPKKYFAGPALFNGIASFITYNGAYEGFSLDPRAVVINYEGLQLEREFYAPVYETEQQYQSRKPDFRNTLFWKPHVELETNSTAAVSFYTSDVKGSYMVVIEGLDENGNAAVAQLPFEVR